MLKVPIDRSHFFTAYQQQFAVLTQQQINGLADLLLFIDRDRQIVKDARHVAYLLATVKHETADTWQPIRERGTTDYFIKRYWHNVRVREALGNLSLKDALMYYGRGYVQLTGRRNYSLFSALLGVNLLENPDLALEPERSYKIMSIGMRHGKFTGKSLRHFIDGETCDYVAARKVVNGTDKAERIADYADNFSLQLHFPKQ